MVEIEMGEHDMPHVAGIEAEPLDLANRRHLFSEVRSNQLEEKAAQAALGMGNVSEAEARVHEDETAGRLDEQAVAREVPATDDRFRPVVHELAAERAGRDAIQMVNAHVREQTAFVPIRAKPLISFFRRAVVSENDRQQGITRRNIVAGLAGAAGLAALPGLLGGNDEAQTNNEHSPAPGPRTRLPVVFLPHGGGPWPFVEMGLDRRETESLAAYTRGLATLTEAKPKALLVISAHWEERIPTVMTSERPPMLYDYYGFPAASYDITWPAPGEPGLALRVREMLGGAGFETAAHASRGFDHGTFVPLKLAFPDADVPTVQLSMLESLDPEEHLRLGRALAPLRDEGILIVGSGMSFHNLRAFGSPRGRAVAEAFDTWLREAAVLGRTERENRLLEWERAPQARAAHPREEHLLPLMVVAGAAGDDAGTIPYSDTFMGVRISAVHYG